VELNWNLLVNDRLKWVDASISENTFPIYWAQTSNSFVHPYNDSKSALTFEEYFRGIAYAAKQLGTFSI
jgi:hypothetical protein